MTDKIPLALLPGLLCDAALWQPQVDALSDVADCRVADLTRQDSTAAWIAGRYGGGMYYTVPCFAEVLS